MKYVAYQSTTAPITYIGAKRCLQLDKPYTARNKRSVMYIWVTVGYCSYKCITRNVRRGRAFYLHNSRHSMHVYTRLGSTMYSELVRLICQTILAISYHLHFG